MLEILDASKGPLIQFSFDQLHKIKDRQIFGFQTKKKIRPDNSVMKDKLLHDAIQNQGLFGQQFDAHVGNITMEDDGGSSELRDILMDRRLKWVCGRTDLTSGEV